MLDQKGPCYKRPFCTEEVTRWETPCFPASAPIISNTGLVEIAGQLLIMAEISRWANVKGFSQPPPPFIADSARHCKLSRFISRIVGGILNDHDLYFSDEKKI